MVTNRALFSSHIGTMATLSHYRPKHVLESVRKWSQSILWPKLRLEIDSIHHGHVFMGGTHASRQNTILHRFRTLILRSKIDAGLCFGAMHVYHPQIYSHDVWSRFLDLKLARESIKTTYEPIQARVWVDHAIIWSCFQIEPYNRARFVTMPTLSHYRPKYVLELVHK